MVVLLFGSKVANSTEVKNKKIPLQERFEQREL